MRRKPVRISKRESRRQFIGQALFCAAAALGVTPCGASSVERASDLIYLAAGELARLIRDKKVSSEEVVRAHLKRIESVNPRINAVCQLNSAGALEAAKNADASLARGQNLGPLHGVAITVKDSFDTAGIISAAGTTGRVNYIPKADATAVAKLRAAGAIILGKTNIPELTLSYETDNLVYGKSSNPFNLERTCGGSSGGAAAIIACGGSPLDIGSDTAGSIRVPAHFCGVAGFKPSFGRVSRAGNILGPGGVVGRRTQIGPMARSVEDLGLVLPIISGPDGRDTDAAPVILEKIADVHLKTLRTAFFVGNGKTTASSDIAQTLHSAARVLADTGSPLEEKCPPGFDEIEPLLHVLNCGDGGDYYRKLLKQCGTTTLHPETAAFLEATRSGVVSGRKYSDVLLDWGQLRESALKFMADFELLLCPVADGCAPRHGGTYALDFSYSHFFNLLGWPAAVVRAGTTPNGLPIGIQIVGRPWKDHEVLAAALRIQQALGGWKKDFNEHHLVG